MKTECKRVLILQSCSRQMEKLRLKRIILLKKDKITLSLHVKNAVKETVNKISNFPQGMNEQLLKGLVSQIKSPFQNCEKTSKGGGGWLPPSLYVRGCSFF